MKNLIVVFTTLICMCFVHFVKGQDMTTIEGYVYETDNRGFLNEAKVTVYTVESIIKAELITNKEGFFSVELPANQKYRIKATKDIFKPKEVMVGEKEAIAGKTHYVKMEMERQPGYLFDVTMAESTWGDEYEGKEALTGALIEIYNNTTNKEELVINQNEEPAFQYTFQQGNHYTIMIRKKGFFTKRMEAHVNVDGCILCFEGLGKVTPGVSDNLSGASGHTMGTLLANVELDKIEINKSLELKNIYYDLGKYDLRPESSVELDKVIAMMKDNPSLILELGSHTDARGNNQDNMTLSLNRATSAVKYILDSGEVPKHRIKARGYGENRIINGCTDGVQCSEEQHQQNRRTEITIVGFTNDDPYKGKSLRQIIYEEKMEEFSTFGSEVVEFKEGDELPEEIRKDLERADKERLKKEKEGDDGQENETETEKEETIEEKVEEVIEETKPSGGHSSLMPEVEETATEIVEEAVVETAPETPKTNSWEDASSIVEEVKEEAVEIVEETVPPTTEKPKNTWEEASSLVEPAEEVVEEIMEEETTGTTTIMREHSAEAAGIEKPNPAVVNDVIEEVVESAPTIEEEPRANGWEVAKPARDVVENHVETTPAPPKKSIVETVAPKEEEVVLEEEVEIEYDPSGVIEAEGPADGGISSSSKPKVMTPARTVSENYNGYMIEFFKSGVELSKDHSIFKQYGRVNYDFIDDEYVYMIGGLESEREANNYLEKVLIARFPKAKVVKYENGKRVE